VSSRTSNEIPTSRPKSCGAHDAWWQLPALLLLVLVWILLSKGRLSREQAADSVRPAATHQRQVEAAPEVSITIDFGDERKSLSNTIPWWSGMTIRGLLSSASLGGFGQKGRGESAFLTQIAGFENEGAGGRNWMYSVNGQRGDRSFEIYELQPGDHVLWSFAPPQ
jgi:hypothetical protein